MKFRRPDSPMNWYPEAVEALVLEYIRENKKYFFEFDPTERHNKPYRGKKRKFRRPNH